MKVKAGDTVSEAFHYIGLVSWETQEVNKVSRDKKKLWISEQEFDLQKDGTYLYTDNTLGSVRKVVHVDGGKLAEEYREKE